MKPLEVDPVLLFQWACCAIQIAASIVAVCYAIKANRSYRRNQKIYQEEEERLVRRPKLR